VTHRDITLTEDERTAALLVYLFACLGYVLDERPGRRTGGLGFYEYVTTHRTCNGRTFGDAVMWALRGEADEPSESAEEWLSYVEHVVGYRCGPGNGRASRERTR
jgi:hypothetical protein